MATNGRFQKGHPGGPGRPRNMITNALRRMTDPDEIAGFLLGVIRSPGVKMLERLRAAELVLDRLEGKAIASVNVNTGAAMPAGWDAMTPAEKVALLDRIELNAMSSALHPAGYLEQLEDDEPALLGDGTP